jgi:CTP:molybdopterin cytidylyltransferase MocA
MSSYSKNSVAIFIPAAGKGARLGNLTAHCPKVLLELNGKPLLSYICEYIRSTGIFNKTIISHGNLNKRWAEFISEFKHSVDFIEYLYTPNILRFIMDSAEKIDDEHILIVNGDTIFNFGIIEGVLATHFKSNNDITICMCVNNYCSCLSWNYILNGNLLIDIIKGKTKKNIERCFFIIKRSVLSDLTCNFTVNLGCSRDDVYDYDNYGNGTTCLLKSILNFLKYKIQVEISPYELFNVNTPDVFFGAEKYLK